MISSVISNIWYKAIQCQIQVLCNSTVHYTFTVAHHWSLSWARWMQITSLQPTALSSILILSTHLCSYQEWHLSFRPSSQTSICISYRSHVCYMPHPSYPPWFYQFLKIVIIIAWHTYAESLQKYYNHKNSWWYKESAEKYGTYEAWIHHTLLFWWHYSHVTT
jgi:hypothetical protein